MRQSKEITAVLNDDQLEIRLIILNSDYTRKNMGVYSNISQLRKLIKYISSYARLMHAEIYYDESIVLHKDYD